MKSQAQDYMTMTIGYDKPLHVLQRLSNSWTDND
jgi:hypothetical protein